jgi:hypothetical protein
LLRTEGGKRRSAKILEDKEDVIYCFTVWLVEQGKMKHNIPFDRKGFDGQ